MSAPFLAGQPTQAVWLHLTAGRGPAECQLALAHVQRRLSEEAAAHDVALTLLDETQGTHGPTALLLGLTGPKAATLAARWTGSLLWTCPSPLRPGHRRKTWFVGGRLATPPADVQDLNPADLEFTACKASGPGGQHVNKTNSAVRLRHRPSGLTVFAQDERSQHRNKSVALARLQAALAARAAAAAGKAQTDRWGDHDALERGAPRRSFQGPGFVETGAARAKEKTR